MSERHELDLLENACDSLNESLRRFEDGTKGEPRAYKFAILHFSHFLELLFKYYVAQSHDLLIYKNPFSNKIEREQTIGLREAIQFLKNEGHIFEDQMLKDLEWIKRLRNEIEHYKFDMDVREVRHTLGRLIQAAVIFNEQLNFFDLEEKIDSECLDTFKTLADEYTAKLAMARQEAQEDSPNGDVLECRECGETDVAYINDKNEIHCKFCDHVEKMITCCQCDESFPSSEMIRWNDDHPLHIDYICKFCQGHIMKMD